MGELLNKVDPFLVLLAFCALLLLVAIMVGIILSQRHLHWLRREEIRLKEPENALKHEMVAKGMAPADIEQVIRASAYGGAAKVEPATHDTSAKGPGFEKARLVQVLAQHEIDADGIERLLRALGDFSDEELPAKIAAVESMVTYEMDPEDIEKVIRAFPSNPTPPGLPAGSPAEGLYRP